MKQEIKDWTPLLEGLDEVTAEKAVILFENSYIEDKSVNILNIPLLRRMLEEHVFDDVEIVTDSSNMIKYTFETQTTSEMVEDLKHLNLDVEQELLELAAYELSEEIKKLNPKQVHSFHMIIESEFNYKYEFIYQ